MKRTIGSLIAVAGVAFAAQAMGAGMILFDQGSGSFGVNTFDWAPDNALAIGALGAAGGTALPATITTVAQGYLDQFLGPSDVSVTSGHEFTFQASITETQIGIGTSTAAFIPTGGTFVVCYDPTADHNQLAGTGYDCTGDAITILSGNIVSGSGAFTDFTRLSGVGFPTVALDQFNTNDYPTITTHQGLGSTNVNVDVLFADPNFFKSNITSLAIDLQTTTNLNVPFTQADPAALVVGNAPSYSGTVNGGDCPVGANGFTQRCDFQFQTDASTSFNPTTIPEPSSLALIGLGILALAWRRNRSSTR